MKIKKEMLSAEEKANIASAVAEEFKGVAAEVVKQALKESEETRKDLKAQNKASIDAYRLRSDQGRRLKARSEALRGMLKMEQAAEEAEETVEEAIGFMTEDQLTQLLNKVQAKLTK